EFAQRIGRVVNRKVGAAGQAEPYVLAAFSVGAGRGAKGKARTPERDASGGKTGALALESRLELLGLAARPRPGQWLGVVRERFLQIVPDAGNGHHAGHRRVVVAKLLFTNRPAGQIRSGVRKDRGAPDVAESTRGQRLDAACPHLASDVGVVQGVGKGRPVNRLERWR